MEPPNDAAGFSYADRHTRRPVLRGDCSCVDVSYDGHIPHNPCRGGGKRVELERASGEAAVRLLNLEMLMDCSVGPVEEVFDVGGTPRAWGFEIMDKLHRPLLLFGYASELDALVARRLILVALEKESLSAHRIANCWP